MTSEHLQLQVEKLKGEHTKKIIATSINTRHYTKTLTALSHIILISSLNRDSISIF